MLASPLCVGVDLALAAAILGCNLRRSRADLVQLVEQRVRNSPNEFVLKFADVDLREFSIQGVGCDLLRIALNSMSRFPSTRKHYDESYIDPVDQRAGSDRCGLFKR